MAPTIQRPGPPYVQIAEHYREQISNGVFTEGARLPSVSQIADEWGVALGTAHKALQYLESAQLVEITRSGTRVRRRRVTPAPRDRVRMSLRNEWLDGETVEVTEAGFTRRPYVAGVLGLGDNDAVVRREQLTYREGEPIMLAVHWLPGELGEAAPELVTTTVLNTVSVVQQATGRTVKYGTDAVASRSADEREAAALQVPPGTPILAVLWTWNDDDGVIEYGEYVCPPEHAITYQYEVTPQETA